MNTEDRLDKVEAVMAITIQSHDRQLGILIDLATAYEAAGKKTDERIEKLVGGIGEFIRLTTDRKIG
jgi:hypothetical protein